MWEIGILDGNISELTTVKNKGTLLVCNSLHLPFYSLSVNMIKLNKLIHVVFKSFINNHWTGCCMHVSNNANMINDASNFIQIVVYIVFSVASLVPFIKSDCCFFHMHIGVNVNIRKYAPDYRTCVYVQCSCAYSGRHMSRFHIWWNLFDLFSIIGYYIYLLWKYS